MKTCKLFIYHQFDVDRIPVNLGMLIKILADLERGTVYQTTFYTTGGQRERAYNFIHRFLENLS